MDVTHSFDDYFKPFYVKANTAVCDYNQFNAEALQWDNISDQKCKKYYI
jgi:hypothetical protein